MGDVVVVLVVVVVVDVGVVFGVGAFACAGGAP
jgi:hypothetical protein